MSIYHQVRAWSETFCIANIEAMAMEVPLVTFAVGGVGEYVHDPDQYDHRIIPYAKSDPSGPFSISSNALVVHEAVPGALAAAVMALVDDPLLAQRVGRAGRESVLGHFEAGRQMQQYALLYRYVHQLGHTGM